MPADLSKVKEAQAKRAKVKKNTTLQYYIWIGGAVAALVGAVVLLIVNPDKGPSGVAVNDDGLITHVNRNAKTWKADKSEMFDGWSLGDAKRLEGISVSGQSQPCVVPDTQVPDSFDAREKWPQCFNQPIYSMGNCTASWAVATASALSNRFCISSPSEYADLMLSPQQLLSCDSANRACAGGDVDAVWGYIEREGLVNESCFPYQGDGLVGCTTKCSDGASLRAASHCHLNNVAAIQKEVFLNGPVAAPIFLVDDFLVYSRGLYQEMPTATQLSAANRQRLIHLVKIVGWGSMQGKNYWLIENSWGADWGEGGYAKIVAGGDHQKRESIMIETYVVAGTPASGKLGDDADDDIDLEDIDLDLEDEDE